MENKSRNKQGMLDLLKFIEEMLCYITSENIFAFCGRSYLLKAVVEMNIDVISIIVR